MRRCIKNCGLGFMAAMFVLIAIASPSGASVEAVKDTTQTVWPSTIYYFGSIENPDGSGTGYGDVVIHITAVHEYELYVNGDLIGTNTDNDWRTVEDYDVTLPAGYVDIAVAVTNYGTGDGNGLMIDIEKPNSSYWLGTSIKQRRSEQVGASPQLYRVQWFYFSGSLADLQGVVGSGNDWQTCSIPRYKDGLYADDIKLNQSVSLPISNWRSSETWVISIIYRILKSMSSPVMPATPI